MNSRINPLFRLIIFVALGFLALRLLPLFARAAQGVAVGLRGYGLFILIIPVAIWIVRKLKRRRIGNVARDPVTNRPTVHVVSETSDPNETRT